MAGKNDERMKEITERLEQGVKELFTSEMYTKYLKTMSQFHNYSFNNTLLIAMQKPDATLVAGYQAWQKKFKRQVKRGEKGIQIIAPEPIREKEEVEKFDPETNEPILRPDGQPETEEVIHTIPRFRVTTVFDVSQTYGEPLPGLETPELMGSVENFEIFMQAIREISPVSIRFDEIESGAKGFYSNANKEIVIQNGMSESQTMKTAVHEVTHAKLHDRDMMEELGEKKNQMTREVEAESVAYTVCQYFGLDTSDYSFPYIAGWSSSVEMKELRASMDTIRKTAGEFIDQVVEKFHEIQKQKLEERDIRMDDLILCISGSMGSEYEYCVIENMTEGQLEASVRDYVRLAEEDAFLENEVSLEDYLTERGAGVFPVYASDGLGEEYPVDFFDVKYDADTGITVFSELSVQKKAGMLIAKAEYKETIFSDEEKNLITNYAYRFDNIEGARSLAEAIMQAHEYPDARTIFQVMETAQEEIDSQTIREYQREMSGIDLASEQEKTENAMGRSNENLYLSGKDDRYAIYQIVDSTKGREYAFMSMDFVNSHNLTVDAADYYFVYGDRLSEGETLGSLYEKFNLNHPENYTGHSLSVSDVIVLQKAGETRAYYVDSFGFQELPDFVRQRLHEDEMNRKREDSKITMDTSGAEIEQHEGLWHTVDKMEIQEEIFYLMRHNEYGDSAAGVIVNADGELVAQELENGFDRGAMEAIQEYFSGKGIAWEPETTAGKEQIRQQETVTAQQSAEGYLESSDKEIVYRINSVEKYLFIQTGTEGYDYTFYDKEYRELDGGVYDDPDISMREALEEILADEGISLSDCEVIDLQDFQENAEVASMKEIEQVQAENSETVTLISDHTEPEAAFNGKSRADIEETVLCFAQAQIEDMGLSEEVRLLGARVYGSRTRDGLYQESSDVDVVLSYSGNIHEDAFFNILHESGLKIAGLPIDVNPISTEKTGTLDKFMENAEKYLDNKERQKLGRSEIEHEPEKVEAKITFYVAECMEFPVLGEYYDNLTLQEAVELYEKIPSERMNGVKGIGFCLEDGSIYDGEYELMSGDKISRDLIDLVPYYKNHPLVQRAISDLEEILSQKKQMIEKTVMPESSQMQPIKQEKTQKKTPEKDNSTSQGTGKKESVLKALKERQARLKEQNQENTEQKSKGRKKGEQEL